VQILGAPSDVLNRQQVQPSLSRFAHDAVGVELHRAPANLLELVADYYPPAQSGG
jgi:hypothetical protein